MANYSIILATKIHMGFEAYSDADARKAATQEASKVAPVFGTISTDAGKRKVRVAENGKITPDGEIWLQQEQDRVTDDAARKAEQNASTRLDRLVDALGLMPDAGSSLGGSPHDKKVTAQALREGDTDYLAGGKQPPG